MLIQKMIILFVASWLFLQYLKLCLSYGSSLATSKAISPQSAVYFFPVFSLFLKVIQQLLTSPSSSPSHFYSSVDISFNNVFYNSVPTQDVTNPVNISFIVCRIFLIIYFLFIYKILCPKLVSLPVPVAARSKAQVCSRSPAEIVSSNPTGGMDACLL